MTSHPPVLHAGSPPFAVGGMQAPTRSAALFAVLQAAAVLAWLAQLVLDAGIDNAASASIVLAASTVTFQVLRGTRSFMRQPFSSLAVLGLCMTTQWGALVIQSIAWTPIADHLRTPVRTFALLGCYQVIALAALWISAALPAARQASAVLGRRVLAPLGVFELPPAGSIWCFGLIGFAAILAGAVLDGQGGVAGKLIDGCRFLAWAPFIIPVLAARVPQYCNLPRQLAGLGVYAVMVVGLGMAVNARTIMFVGVMTVALLALMLALGSGAPVARRQLWAIVPAVALGALGVGFASDLAIATVIVRDQRSSAGPIEMVKLTIETLFDSKVIDTFKGGIDTYSKVALYDEYYIDNQVLARLIETKFHDNMFFLAEDLQPQELEVLRKHTVDASWAILPEPVLQALGVPLDKANLGYSVGDLFDHLHYGHELGSYKVGSLFAHGQALFGAWFFGVYLVMCVLVFVVWNSFSRRLGDGSRLDAPLAMLSVLGIFFNTISGDSIMVVVGFLVRGTAQTVLIYALVLAVTKRLSVSPGGASPAPAAGLPLR